MLRDVQIEVEHGLDVVVVDLVDVPERDEGAFVGVVGFLHRGLLLDLLFVEVKLLQFLCHFLLSL